MHIFHLWFIGWFGEKYDDVLRKNSNIRGNKWKREKRENFPQYLGQNIEFWIFFWIILTPVTYPIFLEKSGFLLPVPPMKLIPRLEPGLHSHTHINRGVTWVFPGLGGLKNVNFRRNFAPPKLFLCEMARLINYELCYAKS